MSTVASWPTQAETWLDERGKGAWIAAMVLGFIFIWPVGLALLALELLDGGPDGGGEPADVLSVEHQLQRPHHEYAVESNSNALACCCAQRNRTARSRGRATT